MAELGRAVSLHALSYGQEIANSGEPSDNSYLVIFTLDGQIEIEGAGYDLVSKSGTVCVMNPNQRFRSRLSADHKQLTLKIAGSLVDECFEGAFGCPPSSPIEFYPRPVTIEGQAGGLGNIVRTLCIELNRDKSSVIRNPVNLHMEHVLAGILIEELRHNHTAQLRSRSDLPPPRYVRNAQDYIHAHACENISIQETAAFASITARALQIGFRKYLHVTPIEYLRNVRLDLAHEELLRGSYADVTITNVAFECGFSSSSKFAEYYRERFGCSPSDVLRGRVAHYVSPRWTT